MRPSVEPRPARRQALVPAILLRLLAVALFSTTSLCVRLAAEEGLPVGQIMFWRSLVALVPIALYLALLGRFPGALATRRPYGHLLRGGLGAVAMICYFAAVARLPLALATALLFMAPLLSVPAGALFLGERPGALIVGAVVAGFAGAGMILWPGIEGPTLDVAVATGVAFGFASAVVTALTRVQIRDLTATEHPATIAFYFSLVAALVSLPALALAAEPVSATAMVWLALAGISGGLMQVFLSEAIARAPVSVLAPFEYLGLVFAFAADLFVFGLLPAPLALGGGLVIVAASATVALRTRARRDPADGG